MKKIFTEIQALEQKLSSESPIEKHLKRTENNIKQLVNMVNGLAKERKVRLDDFLENLHKAMKLLKKK